MSSNSLSLQPWTSRPPGLETFGGAVKHSGINSGLHVQPPKKNPAGSLRLGLSIHDKERTAQLSRFFRATLRMSPSEAPESVEPY